MAITFDTQKISSKKIPTPTPRPKLEQPKVETGNQVGGRPDGSTFSAEARSGTRGFSERSTRISGTALSFRPLCLRRR